VIVINEAKKILPENAIIGISAASVEEAQAAIDAGADYLGIGTMFATPTYVFLANAITHHRKPNDSRKTNTKHIIGTAGTQAILDAISDTGSSVGTVSIGGINLSNVQRVLYQSQAPRKGLDGVAIVSAIMAADDPKAAAEDFAKRINAAAPFATLSKALRADEAGSLLGEVPGFVREVVKAHPLVHNMINYVVANFVANVVLSM